MDQGVGLLGPALLLNNLTFRLSGSEEWSALAYVTTSLQLARVTAEAYAVHAKKEDLTLEAAFSCNPKTSSTLGPLLTSRPDTCPERLDCGHDVLSTMTNAIPQLCGIYAHHVGHCTAACTIEYC